MSSDDATAVCTICQEPLWDDNNGTTQVVTRLGSCGHQFHTKCLTNPSIDLEHGKKPLIKKCPLCRDDIDILCRDCYEVISTVPQLPCGRQLFLCKKCFTDFLVRERSRLQELVTSYTRAICKIQTTLHSVLSAHDEDAVCSDDAMDAVKQSVGSFFMYCDWLMKINV
jgi:hypothetical protein